MKKLILIIIIIFFNKNVFSYNLFDSDFYNVEFTSEDIQNDKIKEINKIKIKSIISIFKRTLNEEDLEKTKIFLKEDFINTFIKNIIINNEKIVNNKYISSIKINFDKKKIIDFFRKNKFSYVEFYPSDILLIIFEKDGLNENLFSKNNNFYNYFKQNPQNKNLFIIPKMDINDRYILKKNDIKNRNIENINKFSNKYKLNEIIIVDATINENNIAYDLVLFSDGSILERKIIYNNLQLDRFFKSLEYETLLLWKEINKIQNNSVNSIKCKVNYFNLFELKEIRKKLDNVTIIKDSTIKTLSYKNTNYDIRYYGNLKTLFKIFNINNLIINNNDELCSIKLK